MALSEEFRTNAQDCFERARNARTLENRIYWLGMAQFWLQLAQHAEEQATVRNADPSNAGDHNGNGDKSPDSKGRSN